MNRFPVSLPILLTPEIDYVICSVLEAVHMTTTDVHFSFQTNRSEREMKMFRSISVGVALSVSAL